MTSYDKIFDPFLSKIKEPLYAEYAQDVAEKELIQLLNDAVFDFSYPKINLKDKDDGLRQFNNNLGFDEIHILSELMVLGWVKTFLREADIFTHDWTPGEVRTFSKANHMRALLQVERDLESKIRRKQDMYNRRDDNDKPCFDQLGGDME